MKIGDLVRVRGETGLIIECIEDDYWGETAMILFLDGTRSEWEKCVLEVLYPSKHGGYGIVPARSLRGQKGRYSGKVEK